MEEKKLITLSDILSMQEVKKLGDGGFGEVWEGFIHGERLAIKRQEFDVDEDMPEIMWQEVEVLNIEHPNLLHMRGSVADFVNGNMYIVTDLLPFDLSTAITQGVIESECESVFLGVARALKKLHDENWIHRGKRFILLK